MYESSTKAESWQDFHQRYHSQDFHYSANNEGFMLSHPDAYQQKRRLAKQDPSSSSSSRFYYYFCSSSSFHKEPTVMMSVRKRRRSYHLCSRFDFWMRSFWAWFKHGVILAWQEPTRRKSTSTVC